jgi:hypothetical protein
MLLTSTSSEYRRSLPIKFLAELTIPGLNRCAAIRQGGLHGSPSSPLHSDSARPKRGCAQCLLQLLNVRAVASFLVSVPSSGCRAHNPLARDHMCCPLRTAKFGVSITKIDSGSRQLGATDQRMRNITMMRQASMRNVPISRRCASER